MHVTWPPPNLIAWMACSEASETSKSNGYFRWVNPSDPLANTLTPYLTRLNNPASRSVLIVMVYEESMRPYHIAYKIWLKFTVYSGSALILYQIKYAGLDPHFGSLLWIGVWPPSNWGRTPALALAFWPLWPRPQELPFPEPFPLPNLFVLCLAPSLSHKLFIVNGRIQSDSRNAGYLYSLIFAEKQKIWRFWSLKKLLQSFNIKLNDARIYINVNKNQFESPCVYIIWDFFLFNGCMLSI